MLKWACNPRLPTPDSPWASQVVAALTTPAFVRRSGILRDHKWMRIPMFRHLYRMELGHGQGQGHQGQGQKGQGVQDAGGGCGDAADATCSPRGWRGPWRSPWRI
jgi:hypothetical protein